MGSPLERGNASLRSGLLMQPLRRSRLPLRATLAGCWACRRSPLPRDHSSAFYRETSLMNERSIESVRHPLKHFHAVLIVIFAIREIVLIPALAAYLIVCLLDLSGLTQRMSPAAWFVAAPALYFVWVITYLCLCALPHPAHFLGICQAAPRCFGRRRPQGRASLSLADLLRARISRAVAAAIAAADRDSLDADAFPAVVFSPHEDWRECIPARLSLRSRSHRDWQ